MDTLKQLRQKREAAHASAKTISEGWGANLATPEQKATFDAAIAERDAYDTQIAALMALNESDRTSVHTAFAGKELKEDKPWANVGEQLLAIRGFSMTGRQSADVRILAALGQSGAVDADGGFAIAPEFSKEIIATSYEVGQLAKECFEIPMASRTYTAPAIDEKSRANGSRWGGVQGFWEGEAEPLTKSQAKLRNLTLTANKVTVLIYDTNESVEDAPALASYIQRVAPDELAFKIDDALYNGPGAGQPLGVTVAPAYIQVPKDAAQVAATITTTNVLNMRSRMPPTSRKTAIWVVTQDAEAYLLNLTRGSGTAVEFLYKLPGERGNNNADNGTMLGNEVMVIEQAAALGTVGDISFVDFQQYYLGRRGGLRADTSLHVAFTTDEMAYRFILRVDGQPIWQQARGQENPASNVLSPYIGLAVRA
jgi:HK97 family phage major capsid protein